MQIFDSERALHTTPDPLAEVTTVRARICAPPEHGRLHMPQEDQSDKTQSTLVCAPEHAAVLQLVWSTRGNGQSPASVAACVTSRTRCICPPPQFLVHVPQAPQAPTTHCCGQDIGSQPRVSVSAGQAAPPPLASATIVRLRDCVVAPHVAPHAPHTDHSDTVHATTHIAVLHALESTRIGHALPPCAVDCKTARSRCWLPLPQSLLHCPQPDHSDTVQSCGHRAPPQRTFRWRPGQAAPPYCAGAVTVRVCWRWPPPQLAVHAVALAQLVTAQSTAHGSVEHDCVSDSGGQLAPALCEITDRVRVWVPPPHVRLHSAHGDHPETAQFDGHACLLQARVSDSAGHEAPPRAADVTTVRNRVARPPAALHSMLHSPHACHSVTEQSMGHGAELHAMASTSLGQRIPPSVASDTTERVRVSVPPPHVAEQAVCDCHSDTTQSSAHTFVLHCR